MLGAIMFLEWRDLAVVPGVMSVTKLLCMVYSGCSACCVVLVLRVVFVLRAVLCVVFVLRAVLCVMCMLVRWSYLFCSFPFLYFLFFSFIFFSFFF